MKLSFVEMEAFIPAVQGLSRDRSGTRRDRRAILCAYRCLFLEQQGLTLSRLLSRPLLVPSHGLLGERRRSQYSTWISSQVHE